jgi:hypothetical protein
MVSCQERISLSYPWAQDVLPMGVKATHGLAYLGTLRRTAANSTYAPRY